MSPARFDYLLEWPEFRMNLELKFVSPFFLFFNLNFFGLDDENVEDLIKLVIFIC